MGAPGLLVLALGLLPNLQLVQQPTAVHWLAWRRLIYFGLWLKHFALIQRKNTDRHGDTGCLMERRTIRRIIWTEGSALITPPLICFGIHESGSFYLFSFWEKQNKKCIPLFQACFSETLKGPRPMEAIKRGKLQNVSDMIKKNEVPLR